MGKLGVGQASKLKKAMSDILAVCKTNLPYSQDWEISAIHVHEEEGKQAFDILEIQLMSRALGDTTIYLNGETMEHTIIN